MILNCLIVDDEPLARQQIEAYVQRIPFLKLAGTARNPLSAKAILDTVPIDLILLDIKMPHMSGIEFIKQSNIFQQVIFVTAFPEYAIEGFELEVTDYLMKPVTFERFSKAIDKARIKLRGSEAIKSIDFQPDFIYVKHNHRFEKVFIADILYIEAMLNYVNIITKRAKYTVYSSLKQIEKSLPPHKLLKIHKSYMVAIDAITAIEQQYLLIGNIKLPVSRTNKNSVMKVAQRDK
ncbi:LytR/AlgR family response regulator transcription factor [Dyadobacter subterraneus]|uniref:Response regulator transcription factor n=1 Tax=Dyadobacter subterraneus TaxID=2773304 RepID=A0ABR9WEK6_9BACT|nr:LytTR family DNA-binding domain-containing protein [Dyadobacter subterraneus]MBE9463833.1 response regulator transcription factor [Dyadobacter subterraneus]